MINTKQILDILQQFPNSSILNKDNLAFDSFSKKFFFRKSNSNSTMEMSDTSIGYIDFSHFTYHFDKTDLIKNFTQIQQFAQEYFNLLTHNKLELEHFEKITTINNNIKNLNEKRNNIENELKSLYKNLISIQTKISTLNAKKQPNIFIKALNKIISFDSDQSPSSSNNELIDLENQRADLYNTKISLLSQKEKIDNNLHEETNLKNKHDNDYQKYIAPLNNNKEQVFKNSFLNNYSYVKYLNNDNFSIYTQYLLKDDNTSIFDTLNVLEKYLLDNTIIHSDDKIQLLIKFILLMVEKKKNPNRQPFQYVERYNLFNAIKQFMENILIDNFERHYEFFAQSTQKINYPSDSILSRYAEEIKNDQYHYFIETNYNYLNTIKNKSSTRVVNDELLKIKQHLMNNLQLSTYDFQLTTNTSGHPQLKITLDGYNLSLVQDTIDKLLNEKTDHSVMRLVKNKNTPVKEVLKQFELSDPEPEHEWATRSSSNTSSRNIRKSNESSWTAPIRNNKNKRSGRGNPDGWGTFRRGGAVGGWGIFGD